MKAMVMFDTQAMPYEVKSNLGAITKLDGITNPVLLEKSVGEVPQYCLQLDIADNKSDLFQQHMKVVAEHYGRQISNLRVVLYHPLIDTPSKLADNGESAVSATTQRSRRDRVKEKLGNLKNEDPNIYPLW